MSRQAVARNLGHWRTSHIVLIGEMAAGKTAVGAVLAEKMHRPHLDTDQMLQSRAGTTGASVAASEGVEALHGLELRVLMDAVTGPELAVITPAASVLDSSAGREALQGHVVVWLDAPAHVRLERIVAGDHRRTVEVNEVERLRHQRLRHYLDVADLQVDTEKTGPEGAAMEVLEALPGFRKPQGE